MTNYNLQDMAVVGGAQNPHHQTFPQNVDFSQMERLPTQGRFDYSNQPNFFFVPLPKKVAFKNL